MAELLPVTFHGDTLFLVEHNGERVGAARLQLETASGIDFAPTEQVRLDLLTAAHMQCHATLLFIINQYNEELDHAAA